MKIATWNIERLKHKRDLEMILKCCEDSKADILVLTETDRLIEPVYPHIFRSLPAFEADGNLYRETENRVSIYSRYKCIRTYETFDKYTALCVELETERGSLIVYGTIMGIFGNREKSYERDLKMQLDDIRRLSLSGSVCVIGDFNCSFADNYYFTESGRAALNEGLDECGIKVMTGNRKECIDHIAVSEAFVRGAQIAVEEWNYDKSLSDHKGIVVEIL